MVYLVSAMLTARLTLWSNLNRVQGLREQKERKMINIMFVLVKK